MHTLINFGTLISSTNFKLSILAFGSFLTTFCNSCSLSISSPTLEGEGEEGRERGERERERERERDDGS